VAHSGEQRHYVSLHRDEFVDVWLLCWMPGDDTGWHDHDTSSGAVRVVRGSIHAYSPPLWRLGQYSIDADGVMRRASVSYADELRPVDGRVAA